MALYKGYKIVGEFPQVDVWEVDDDEEPIELVNQYDRWDEPEHIEIWSQNDDGGWWWDNEFEGQYFKTVAQAKEAIDKVVIQ